MALFIGICCSLNAVCVARGWNYVLYGLHLLLKELLSKGLILSHGWQTIPKKFCIPKAVALTVGPFLVLKLMESRTRFHRSVLS